MNKHAYLILAHKNPQQLKTLLSLLDDERNDIFVHIDKKAPFSAEDFQDCCSKSQLEFIQPRIRVAWGGVSIINVEIALLKAATRTQHSYYHLLSGLDLPIKPQNHIHDFFEANPGREFLDMWKMEGHTMNRVKYYTLFPEGHHFFLTSWINNAVKFFARLMHIEMNKGIEFRQSSQWMSITHGFATYILQQEEWIDKVFSHSCICDEIFIPTLLFRSPYKENLYPGNMRHIDWSRGSSIRHPWTYTIKDYDLLKSSPCLWARKFDENVDADIIKEVAGWTKG